MDADVIVVGAGLSGLVAANGFEDADYSVIVLDKGRSVGGRLATRRIGYGVADHGAQFFTARTPEFQQQIDEWIEKNLVSIWGHGWSDGSLKRSVNDGNPRYIAKKGMTQLAKALAANLEDVRLNITVKKIQWEANLWYITDEDGTTLSSRALVMTAPVPQSLTLLEEIPLTDTDRSTLEQIVFRPCLCGLFVIEGKVNFPEPGAIQNFERAAYWMADNQAKGISPDECIVTLHLEARYSRQHYDDNETEILDFMHQELQTYLEEGATIKEAQLKKWKYSLPLTTYPHDILLANGLPLIFAGDGFGGRGRVEGAYMSGLAAGKTNIQVITS